MSDNACERPYGPAHAIVLIEPQLGENIGTVTLADGKTLLAGDSSFAYAATGAGAAVVLDANGNPVSNTGTEILGTSGKNTLTGTAGNDLMHGIIMREQHGMRLAA